MRLPQQAPPVNRQAASQPAHAVGSAPFQDPPDFSKEGPNKLAPAAIKPRDLLGRRITVDYRYRRGVSLSDGSNYVGLCNVGFALRKLPEGYSPSYVNDIVCQPGEMKCLSGWGSCRERLLSVNVLEKGIEKSIFVSAGCECQVEKGSPLHTFAMR